jgi:hypothetical protein
MGWVLNSTPRCNSLKYLHSRQIGIAAIAAVPAVTQNFMSVEWYVMSKKESLHFKRLQSSWMQLKLKWKLDVRIIWFCDLVIENMTFVLEKSPKNMLSGKFYNTSSVGKPRTRWEGVVQRDALQVLGIRGWRRRVGNREKCRCHLRGARSQKGLQRHTWIDGLEKPLLIIWFIQHLLLYAYKSCSLTRVSQANVNFPCIL